MKRTARPLALALIAALLPLQGCLVTARKYRKLEAERDRLSGLLQQHQSDQDAAEDTFRRRLEAATQELDLYKNQATTSKEDAEKTRAELEKLKKARQEFLDQVKAIGVGTVRDGRLVLQGAALFQLGSARLSAAGRRDVGRIATAFKGKDVLIQIDGHTDTTRFVKERTKALHGDNPGLAAHRALAVFRELRAKGIPERKMYVRGFGSTWPVASNATAAGKTRNRRVEILFIPSAMVPRPKG